MVAKNIFEKLGLIEKIDDDNIENDEILEEKLSDSELDFNDLEDESFNEDYEEESFDTDFNDIGDVDLEPEIEKEILDEISEEIDEEIYEEINDVEDETEIEETPSLSEIQSIDQNIYDEEELEEEQSSIENKLDALIGSYEKNKLLSIDDIYRNARLTLDTKKSIFMVDILNKTLPENLPIDVKRETVLSLMNVSELKRDELLNDAYKRIDSLDTVLEDTVEKSEQIIEKNNNTIKELQKRIEELEEINDKRLEFQQDQNTLIEYEIQKIINLVDFVKPKK